jgi:hypothetical protein
MLLGAAGMCAADAALDSSIANDYDITTGNRLDAYVKHIRMPAAKAYEDLVLDKWWTRWTGTADAQGRAEVRAFYGKHKVTVNGKETLVTLTKAEGSKTVNLN